MFIPHRAILVTSVVRYAQGDTRLHIYMAVSLSIKQRKFTAPMTCGSCRENAPDIFQYSQIQIFGQDFYGTADQVMTFYM